MSDYLSVLPYAAAAISILVCGLGLLRVWLGWSVRRLYAGPTWREEPEERLLPVFLYRLGTATGWTVVGMAALLSVGLVLTRMTAATAAPLNEAVFALLAAHGWWLTVVVFAVSATREFDRIWDDLNARDAALHNGQHTQRSSGSQVGTTISTLRPGPRRARKGCRHTEGE